MGDSHRKRRWERLLILAILIPVIGFVPKQLRGQSSAGVADFAAPMTAKAAKRLVEEAQRAQDALRPAPSEGGDAVPAVYVAQSGHHLTDRAGFLSFWRTHGGVTTFGYPITEELEENGRLRQYFERARFEYHPEQADPNYRVQLSLLGAELTEGRTFPKATPGSGEQFFPETGHAMSGVFLQFWRKRGGLAVFGFPISEPFPEVSPVDGKTYTVQYFERARFEHHPDELDPFYRQQAQQRKLNLAALYEVQLADLGRQAAKARRYVLNRTDQVAGTREWSPALWKRRVDVNLTTQQLTAYEDDVPVFHAPVATGKDGFNTPVGTYAIYAKYPRQTMAGGWAGESWYVPNIPSVQYIVGGVAFHGTYWHDKWGTGTRMSHGCINLNIDDAQWLYAWADVGTQVNIFD